MKNTFLKFTSLLLILVIAVSFSSCTNSKNILKTKEISSNITQTNVILSNTLENTDAYEKFLKTFKPSFTIPGLFEGVIPQGICYIDDLKAFVVSGYYEEAELPSVIMVLNKDGKLQKSLTLKNIDGSYYYGHAGGVACSENYLFITSDSECYVISTETLKNTENEKSVQFESNFKLNTLGSFAACNNNILWVGDFIESSKKAKADVENVTTLQSGETFYAYCEGYILEDGLPDVKKINSEQNGYIPDYILAIPEQVQGMSFTVSGKTVFSTSYGRKNNSTIYVYDDALLYDSVRTVNIDNKEIKVYACSSEILKETITAPPMTEGICTADGKLVLLFESGASKYRQHGGKYPSDTVFTSNIE
ncbi:MAG: hypothetical protein ACI4IF_07015 [Acutalibacteraceae bacterium]